jgi:hypothetical protein
VYGVSSDLSRAISYKFYKLNSMPFDDNLEDVEAKGDVAYIGVKLQ